MFPIELHLMKGLKKLNLANNSLSLLPRKIDVMTNLETLDLSRYGILSPSSYPCCDINLCVGCGCAV